MTTSPRITLVGGPTALIELGGFRLLTDPTFDAPGEYRLPHVTLRKTARPALATDAIGPIDAVLLSHDQHADNLDRAGRALLARAARAHDGRRRRAARRQRARPAAVGRDAPAQARRRHAAHHRDAGAARPGGIEPFSGDVIGFVLAAADAHRPRSSSRLSWRQPPMGEHRCALYANHYPGRRNR